MDPNARFYQVMDFRLPDAGEKDPYDPVEVTAAPVFPLSHTLHAEKPKKGVNALIDADASGVAASVMCECAHSPCIS